MGFADWFERTAVPWFTSLGLTRRTITLEVAGRKTGRPHRVTVATLQNGGSLYLVSVHGESDWVRNVRAAGGKASILSAGRKQVRLEEIPVAQRAPLLLLYVSKSVFGRPAADIARQFGVETEPTLEQMAALSDRHPVFRIAPGP